MVAPVILEGAINGQTPKSTNPSVPRDSEEIAADALRCIAAGAAVIHTHRIWGPSPPYAMPHRG